MSASLLLGSLTPILPAFGYNLLLFCALLFLISRAFRGELTRLEWALPFLALVLVWFVASFVWGFDFELYRFAAQGGTSEFFRHIAASWPQYVTSGLSALRVWVLFGILTFFARHPSEARQFYRGLEAGLLIAAVVTSLQLILPQPLPLPNQTDFWNGLDRRSGTFTDPNAFGIFVVLCLPLLLGKREGEPPRVAGRFPWRWVLALWWSVLALYSGSRSFFVGVGFYLVYLFALHERRRFLLSVAVGVGLLVMLNLFALLLPAQWQAVLAAVPEGLRRVGETLFVGTMAEALFSRAAFWSVGWSMWLDNFFFGVGPEAFRLHFVEYAHELHLRTGIWSDNSNNFYLGLLAEFGVLGALALALTLVQLRWREKGTVIIEGRAPVFCLALLLLLGPHLSFDEVAVLGAFLLANTFRIQSHATRPVWVAAAAGLALLVVAKAAYLPRGVYPFEQQDGELFRWSRRWAALNLHCRADGATSLTVRALHPDISARPVRVQIDALGQRWPLSLSDSQPQSIEIPCAAAGGGNAADGKVHVRIEIDRVWSPLASGMGGDARVLGLQIFVPAA